MDIAKMKMVINSSIECNICLQVCLDPRILPCGHTFCLSCLQNVRNLLFCCARKNGPLLQTECKVFRKYFRCSASCI